MSSRDLSVLKKVISKLNGLTLETAIEVIDRAIAAEDKLAEIDKQEPIYMWQLDDEDGWIECTKAWFYGHMSKGYEKRIVYASPVQQSPAVAAPDRKVLINADLVRFLNGECEYNGYWFGDESISNGKFWWRAYLPKIAKCEGEIK